jgi:hypothetical protein
MNHPKKTQDGFDRIQAIQEGGVKLTVGEIEVTVPSL